MLGTLIAYGLYMNGLRLASASEANIVLTLEPLSSALVGILLLHQLMTPLQYLGGLIMIAAVVILQVFEKKTHN